MPKYTVKGWCWGTAFIEVELDTDLAPHSEDFSRDAHEALYEKACEVMDDVQDYSFEEYDEQY